MTSLALVQVGPESAYPVNQLLTLISSKLPELDPMISRPILNVNEAYNSGRNQYHSTRIISILENDPDLNSFQRKLGITDLDLYNPAMDGEGYVIGEARCPGSSAIISTNRLGSSSLDSRLKKEVIHELGHMKGLTHCSYSKCVMHHSVIASGVDAKTWDYCSQCYRNLQEIQE